MLEIIFLKCFFLKKYIKKIYFFILKIILNINILKRFKNIFKNNN
jgi:hypothetical protein